VPLTAHYRQTRVRSRRPSPEGYERSPGPIPANQLADGIHLKSYKAFRQELEDALSSAS